MNIRLEKRCFRLEIGDEQHEAMKTPEKSK